MKKPNGLVLVTGISTSGKSTIAKELSKRGYEAHDLEHNGISAWHNKLTGVRAAEFGQVPEQSETWLNQHEWIIDINWVKQKAEESLSKTIFLCGGGSNESEISELCAKVIWLATDETTIRKRVVRPRDHTYGTQLHELELIITGNKEKEAEYRDLGAIIINARQSINDVADSILAECLELT